MNVSIIDFCPAHAEAFGKLNYAWISKYFKVEDIDKKILDDPQEQIVNKGGVILIAEYRGEVVGTCALLNKGERTFELAKMAVIPKVQGHQIGYKLGQEAIRRAKNLGARLLFLETNSSLKPALSLYAKLGFQKMCEQKSPYSRCDVQMELTL